MTDASWYGVTPEPVATFVPPPSPPPSACDISNSHPRYVANDIIGWDNPKTTIVDLFAGAGGNAIAFALSSQWTRVIAIEKDASTLACAQHNAAIYDVDTQITWVHGDCFEFLARALSNASETGGETKGKTDAETEDVDLAPELHIDPAETVLFASPPWGGPGYTTDEVFDLSQMQPYNLAKLHAACKSVDYALYLPRTSDLRQLAKLVPDGQKVDVVQYCMRGASKAMVAYMPAQPVAEEKDQRPPE